MMGQVESLELLCMVDDGVRVRQNEREMDVLACLAYYPGCGMIE